MIEKPFNPTDWYWVVNGAQVYSSKTAGFVSSSSPEFLAWKADGTKPTAAASDDELGQMLALCGVRPTVASVLAGFVERQTEDMTRQIVSRLLFNMENRIRVLEGRPQITAAQYRAAIKALL